MKSPNFEWWLNWFKIISLDTVSSSIKMPNAVFIQPKLNLTSPSLALSWLLLLLLYSTWYSSRLYTGCVPLLLSSLSLWRMSPTNSPAQREREREKEKFIHAIRPDQTRRMRIGPKGWFLVARVTVRGLFWKIDTTTRTVFVLLLRQRALKLWIIMTTSGVVRRFFRVFLTLSWTRAAPARRNIK